MCEVELLPDHHITTSSRKINSAASSDINEKSSIARHLFLQGQTKYVKDWDAIIFLCNPLYSITLTFVGISSTFNFKSPFFCLISVNNLEDLAEMGLFVSDLSLHGNSRDLMMKGWQHNAR